MALKNKNIVEDRFERKYTFNHNDINIIINNLFTSHLLFRFDHPKRDINSIYFDNNFNNLVDNLEGISEREKYRLRWYDNSNKIANFYIEKKIKKNFLSKKIRQKYSLNSEILIDDTKNLSKLFYEYINPNYEPIVSVHYERLYFVSSIYNIRATIDYNIYSRKFMSNILNKEKFFNKNIVLEIKYNKNLDEIFRKEIKSLNLRFSKSSKYVNSIVENPISISL